MIAIYENYYVGSSDTHKLNRIVEGLFKHRSKIVLATVSYEQEKFDRRKLLDARDNVNVSIDSSLRTIPPFSEL